MYLLQIVFKRPLRKIKVEHKIHVIFPALKPGKLIIF